MERCNNLKGINVCFWETAHLPIRKPNIDTYFSPWAKCWVWEGVGGQFPSDIITLIHQEVTSVGQGKKKSLGI